MASKAEQPAELNMEEQVLLGAFRVLKDCDKELEGMKKAKKKMNDLTRTRSNAVAKIESIIYGEQNDDDEAFGW